MSFYNNMEVQAIEVWTCDRTGKAAASEGKGKGEYKKHAFYKALSPFNFFRQNIVFEVSKNMTLGTLAQEIFGRNQVFIKYPGDGEVDSATQVGSIG